MTLNGRLVPKAILSSSCHRCSSFCRKVPEKPLLESTWSYSYTPLSAPATQTSWTAGSSRGLLVTLGGRCLSQLCPQGLPQDNLSLVIHLVGWVLPLGPEISPSLHHSWVRPVTPPPCDFLRGLAVGPCPPASPPVPGCGPILGLTYQAGLSWGGGNPQRVVLGKMCIPMSGPHPGPAAPLPSTGWASAAHPGPARPFITRLPRGALPLGHTSPGRLPAWLGQRAWPLWKLPPKFVEAIFFWSQGQLFGEGQEMSTHLPAPLRTCSVTLGKRVYLSGS